MTKFEALEALEKLNDVCAKGLAKVGRAFYEIADWVAKEGSGALSRNDSGGVRVVDLGREIEHKLDDD